MMHGNTNIINILYVASRWVYETHI